MAVADDRMAEIRAAFGIAAKNAEVADLQKKLEDAVASAVSLDAFNAFADEHLAAIKGAMA